ncbi:hypothetical protein RUND412_005664 [Rhizina undulata]
MSGNVSPNCLLYGDPFEKGFSIKISKGEDISTFKELIKEKRKTVFEDIDAADLILWRVSIPYRDILAYPQLELEPGSQEGIVKLVNPFEEIQDVFMDVIKKHVHVIIQCPSTYIPEVQSSDQQFEDEIDFQYTGYTSTPPPCQMLKLSPTLLGRAGQTQIKLLSTTYAESSLKRDEVDPHLVRITTDIKLNDKTQVTTREVQVGREEALQTLSWADEMIREADKGRRK